MALPVRWIVVAKVTANAPLHHLLDQNAYVMRDIPGHTLLKAVCLAVATAAISPLSLQLIRTQSLVRDPINQLAIQSACMEIA